MILTLSGLQIHSEAPPESPLRTRRQFVVFRCFSTGGLAVGSSLSSQRLGGFLKAVQLHLRPTRPTKRIGNTENLESWFVVRGIPIFRKESWSFNDFNVVTVGGISYILKREGSQLGLSNSQLKYKENVPNHQPVIGFVGIFWGSSLTFLE